MATTSETYIGTPTYNVDAAQTFCRLAMDDENAARTLMNTQSYRQAVLLFVQAMEKYVRYSIFSMVDARSYKYRERTTTHELDDLLACLIEVASDDARIRQQVQQQLDECVVEGVKFRKLHNNIRYPWYSEWHNSYSVCDFDEADALATLSKLEKLKAFLADIQLLRSQPN